MGEYLKNHTFFLVLKFNFFTTFHNQLSILSICSNENLLNFRSFHRFAKSIFLSYFLFVILRPHNL